MGKTERIAAYLDDRIALGDFPGAVVACREAGQTTALVARGLAVVVPEAIPATTETIYDLASLTKTLATTVLVALELESGRIGLDDPVYRHLPEFDRDDKRHIAIHHLLTHCSGLPAWVPLYIDPGDRSLVVHALAALPLAYETGTRVVYSDPNFIALGAILERLSLTPLDHLFATRIAAPLGLWSTGFRPDPSLRSRIAASETGNEYERAMVKGDAIRFAHWRTDVVWGEVHDGNAHFLGGVAGHAGLFGTALDVARIAEQCLPGSELLTRESTFALFRRNFTQRLEQHRSIGWMLASTPESSAGASMPRDAFGHTGFTGTSVWIDPNARRVNVLLTNRTHPVYHTPPMTDIRRRINELAAD